ncbi:cell envelope biogenesis protein TolA [Stakelama sp. CBK3Z-3]|uniref:Cell envelope biogenesis protein TolA n=1 Tax=Stakelama flava TaxID=2860338 RepID=A0ABS6XRX5_9SPHN|nr:cell envelope biogenesis protein TolA [Stakelama flava]MBW4332176.1 cell envelope biogenesis protein TolA [Stakelama flava]
MNRGEASAIAVAALGHVILFGLLSAGFAAAPNPMELKSKPIDVSLVDAVAIESAAPTAIEPPAKSIAPDTGKPSDAPPPASAEVSDPAPESPAPEKAPAAKTSDTPAPEKPKPKPASEKSDSSKTASHKAPSRKTEKSTPTKSEGKAKAKPDKPRGSRLGDDFLKGITDNGEGKSTSPRAEKISNTIVAGLADAIQRQVQPCANRITNPGPGANEITSKLRIQMNRDGSLAAKPQLRGQSGVNGENRRYAQRVAELAMSAFIACAPYDLPAEYYDVGGQGWKDIILNYKLPG